ncbi:outer membrane receptor protein involved in Fe transport [Methylorubrum thiocyanatum]|uniref:Outer membrane receptor protein involved in Fe transport n=1 Tax=Methylorubrum thiocyanatum TaxID=47958 RepID=A0AA40S3K3_9HYPH|nr:outer membrane receptor protein involved in Fe transport [Methylorubrum thiocyanatum]GJE81629.1 Vitamin B12 transporter BtuB [Methylorubrum thiocyanatum]
MLLGSAACTSIAPVLIQSIQAQVTEINTGLPTAQAVHPLAASPSVGGITLDMISLAGSGLGRGVVVDSSGSQVGYVAQRLRSATKTDTPLIDTPQAISVVTEAQIRDQNVQSIGEALRYVPGVAIAQGEGHRDAILIRGQRTTADFFVNGIRDDARNYRDLYNTQRIEVLKGPNAMTFGRGGGVVNRVLKEADGLPLSGRQLRIVGQRGAPAELLAVRCRRVLRIQRNHARSGQHREPVRPALHHLRAQQQQQHPARRAPDRALPADRPVLTPGTSPS